MRSSPQQLLSIPNGAGPLYLQVYHRIRTLILTGAWPPGTRLPSSRALARDLGMSRNTGLLAVEMLMADGWIVSRAGSGIFVSSEAPPARHFSSPAQGDEAERGDAAVPFDIAQGATDIFPVKEWAKIHARVWTRASKDALHEGAGAGWEPLRRSVAGYLHAVRGLACSPEQVLIMSSAQAAVDLTIRVLASPGDSIWVEDPGYLFVREAFRAHGLRQVLVPVDDDGIIVSEGIASEPRARLAYVTPASQLPTCAILANDRRSELLDWARRTGSYVIEDDWDFNAVFDGRQPPEPVAASCPEQVVFIHSFNRLLFPALRIAVLVAPVGLADKFIDARRAIDGFPNMANQIALAEFIDRGLLSAHLRKSKVTYARRRAALHSGVRQHLSRWLHIDEERPGLIGLAFTPPGRDSEMAAIARSNGIACIGLSDFKVNDSASPAALPLGFAAYPEEVIDDACRRLAEALAA